MNIANQVQDNLNKLTAVVSDVNETMEDETYGVDPKMPLVPPAFIPPIKVLTYQQTLEATEEASTATADNNVAIDFSKLFLEEVYNIQQETATKIRIRENVVTS